ncbi:MAG: 5-(carboxyamino)imidazole ribonucleotide mutase [Ruminococcaceae bacterium]|nr:5-(carboxyamino)imidazole ribonucleotide mutase [Oscillospiraceae bacterium]
MKKVAIIIGSDSDFPVVKKGLKILKEFNIDFTIRVMSAHRTPVQAAEFAENAEKEGYGVIIAAAGKAAHLAGVIAGHSVLPVIGIPIKSSTMDGLDSLLSTVQMPKGIPVATVAIDGAENAALLAIQMLSLSEPSLVKKLYEYKENMVNEVMAKDKQLQESLDI